MRLIRFVVAASTVLSFAAAKPALAQYTNGTQAFQNNAEGKPTNAAGFFEGNVTVFGVPNQQNKIGEFPKLGVKLEGSAFRAQGTAGPCSGSVGVGNVEAYAQVGLGVSTTGPAGGGTYRGTQPAPSGRFSPPSKNGRANGGGAGPGGLVQCSAGVEVSAISLQGSCDTPVGTIAGSVKGVGAQAECGCTGCFAEAYWAKAGVDYTTPAIGGCGFKASVTAGAEVMAGVAAGAGVQGTVGAKVKLGPVGVKLGLNVEEFDPAKMGECLTDAAKAVGRTAVAIGEGAYNAGKAVVGFVGDTASAIGNSVASGAKKVGCFFSGLFGGGCDNDDETKAGGDTSAGGTAVAGGTSTTPGVSVGLNDLTTATASVVFDGLTQGRLPGQDPGPSTPGADAAGMSRD